MVIDGALSAPLAPGNGSLGQLYALLNGVIGVAPEDANHWHEDV